MKVLLDRSDVLERIMAGDGAFGGYVLAVAPDGSAHKLAWIENNRQWNPWPDDYHIASIPALDPDGSGRAVEDAQDTLRDCGLWDRAMARHEAEDIGYLELVEELCPDEWMINRRESTDWLADEWLSDLNDDDGEIWGYDWQGESLAPQGLKFEWFSRRVGGYLDEETSHASSRPSQISGAPSSR